MIRVYLVDDHELVRTGFRMLLQQHTDFSVVGEAGSRVAWLIAGWGRGVDVAGRDVGAGDASCWMAAAATSPPGSSARCRMNSTRKTPFNIRETARTAPSHLLPIPFSF